YRLGRDKHRHHPPARDRAGPARQRGAITCSDREAEGAAAARSRFLAATSHDLRQPLQLIMSTHDLLRQSIRKPKDLNTLRRGERATARLARAFEKLVQIARLDTGASAPQIKTFPLQPLLQEI